MNITGIIINNISVIFLSISLIAIIILWITDYRLEKKLRENLEKILLRTKVIDREVEDAKKMEEKICLKNKKNL